MSGAETGLELAPVGEQEQDEDITETEDADTEVQTPGVPAQAAETAETAEAAEVDTPAKGYCSQSLYFIGHSIDLQIVLSIDTLSESNEKLEVVEESFKC